MSSGSTQRRLAAILAAHVVGYYRLIGKDETRTLATFKAARTELIDLKVLEHTGRVTSAERIRNSYYERPGPASTGLPVHGFADPDCRITVELLVTPR